MPPSADRIGRRSDRRAHERLARVVLWHVQWGTMLRHRNGCERQRDSGVFLRRTTRKTASSGGHCSSRRVARMRMISRCRPNPCTLWGMVESPIHFGVTCVVASPVTTRGTLSHAPGSTHSPPALRAAWGGHVPRGCWPRRTSSGKLCFEHQYRGDTASWLASGSQPPNRSNNGA